MKFNARFIQFDQIKLNSIGFTNSTICELTGEFSVYLAKIEKEYKQQAGEILQQTELRDLLHKLEGAMKYLALSGPIDYINLIRESLKHDSNINSHQEINNLFHITKKTVDKLNLHYSNFT